MLGKRSNQRGLFEADTVYLDFVGCDSFYGYLASERGRLFRDEDFADLYCHTNGRNSVPPSMLATALILQTCDRVSDAEAKDRADYDMRWKVALGIELNERPFAKSTLQLFRAQLIIHDKTREIFRRSLQKAKESGFLRRRKKLHAAVDTMVILGRGAVKDTYNLLADGTRKLSRVLAELAGSEVSAWAVEHGLERYFAVSIKGTTEVDWDDPASRQKFLAGIVADADRLLELARQAWASYAEQSNEAKEIAQAADLLMQLLAQDIERKDDGPEIRQGVAKDRIISVHDPEMRHGRKSSKGRFDGHKGAVMVDSESQLITAVEMIPAGAHDGDTALPLVEQSEQNTGLPVVETVGDCAYGDGETRRQFAEAERKIIAPVPSPPRSGKLPKTSFRIGRKQDRVTCPAGCVTRHYTWVKLAANRAGRRYRVKRFMFRQERCAACPLKASCIGESAGPRTITLHPRESEIRRARKYQRSKAFRRAKRRRQVVEHRIARLRQLGVRQARYMGRAKTLFQLLMAATVANLTLVAGSVSAAGTLASRFLLVIGRYLCSAGRHSASEAHSGFWYTGQLRTPAIARALLPSKTALKKRGFRPRF